MDEKIIYANDVARIVREELGLDQTDICKDQIVNASDIDPKDFKTDLKYVEEASERIAKRIHKLMMPDVDITLTFSGEEYKNISEMANLRFLGEDAVEKYCRECILGQNEEDWDLFRS